MTGHVPLATCDRSSLVVFTFPRYVTALVLRRRTHSLYVHLYTPHHLDNVICWVVSSLGFIGLVTASFFVHIP
jgi:hypothetical protein